MIKVLYKVCDRNTHCKKMIKTNTKQTVTDFYKIAVHLSFYQWLLTLYSNAKENKVFRFLLILPASISFLLQMSTAYLEL